MGLNLLAKDVKDAHVQAQAAKILENFVYR
jgi:hypothetical protein